MRIGVECGGTFTDVVVLDDHGRLVASDKIFSTPDQSARAVTDALARVAEEDRVGARLLHGSTIATNALIERKGATIGLIVTRGFQDIVFLQRQDRATMYDLAIQTPQPLVTRDHVVEVVERLDARGNVTVALDDETVRQALRDLVAAGVDAVAVSLLHSYANPAHEQRIREIARDEFPELVVALSSTSAREFREYERTTTTTVDAFLRPQIAGYLGEVAEHAEAAGIAELSVMQSNGGMVPARVAADHPLSMLRSGPAAGVAGALAVARNAGVDDIITMDMGGTSTDVAVVLTGQTEQTAEMVADGLPLRVPMIDITAVGAGGGSIADIDSGGLMSVGPESAGAVPGPVSYGRGGTRPTVTDANVVRGLLRPETFLGGTHELDCDAARDSFETMGDQLGRSVEQVVEDVYELASVNMANAIRLTTTERGYEVQRFTLVAYGGAGPLHAASVADQLGVTRVLVPPHNGLASAYGLLTAGFRREFSRTHITDMADMDVQALEGLREAMREATTEQLTEQGIDVSDVDWEFTADMRYRGQGFEVSVEMLDTDRDALVARFHDVHATRYGHAEPERSVQLVTLRLTATKPEPPRSLPHLTVTPERAVYELDVLERGERVRATFLARDGLAPGIKQHGPAVVEDTTSTAFVPTGWVAHVDEHTNLILERSGDR